MLDIIIREPRQDDMQAFIAAMKRSQSLHQPWVRAPLTREEFQIYLQRYQEPNQKSFFVCDSQDTIYEDYTNLSCAHFVKVTPKNDF